MRAWSKPEGLDAFPVRGARCADPWDELDVREEIAAARRRMTEMDIAVARLKREYQAERRARERPRRRQGPAT